MCDEGKGGGETRKEWCVMKGREGKRQGRSLCVVDEDKRVEGAEREGEEKVCMW